MIHVRARLSSGELVVDPPAERLSELVGLNTCLLWIDIQGTDAREIEGISTLLHWEPLTQEDVVERAERTKLERFEHYFYLVMHDLLYSQEAGLDTPEVDFVVGPNWVVTAHPHEFPHVEEAKQVLERVESVLKDGPGYLLYFLTDALVDGYLPVLDRMDDAVEDLEQLIIRSPSENLLPRIFSMKRDAITLRKAIGPELEVYTRLTSPGFGLIDEKHVIYFRDVHDHLVRVFEAMDTYRELMSGALDAYLSNINNRLSDVMKRLTVLAALFLPLTFITGVFGMNMRSNPPWSDVIFWLILAGMATISFTQWLYFRKKGWV